MVKQKIKDFFGLFSTEGKSLKYRIVLYIISFLVLVVAGTCLGLLSLYFDTATYKFELFNFYLDQPKLVILNVVPFVLLCLLGWFISNRPWIGFLCSGVFCLAYSFTNYFKIVSRDDPFFAEDITLIKEAMQMSGQYVNLTFKVFFAVGLIIVGTLIIALLVRGKNTNVIVRVISVVLMIALCVVLYSTIYTSDKIYNNFGVWENFNPWFENSRYISRGGIYPFIYSIKSATPSAPDGYNKKDAAAVLDKYEYDEIPEDKKVNVMIVMYEAYSDLSKYTDKITGVDPYVDFHNLQAESYSGELVTNIFAGGTIDSERCVMTGFSDLTSFRRSSWSYVRYFAEMGYSVEGTHAGYQSFYNRNNVNRNIGFEEYYFIENYFNQIYDGIPADYIYMPEIVRMFKEKIESSDEKAFSFNVTYQNHGPYPTTMTEGQTIYVPHDGLEPADHAIINNYLKGIENTSYHMMNTANQFRDYEEPVVLVFFGDHKPWLGDFSSTYTALGIDIFDDTEQSFYNHYNTEYLIWANDTAKEVLGNDFVGEGPSISPCFLMNLLFEQCGWEGPEYMKLANEVMEQFPVITTNKKVVTDNKMIDEEDVEDKTLIDIFRKVQFYLERDFYK
ncbi:MAG: sulfatase-like hydrolase/transferase [Clostridia bacterium]|nr:sulfatase-like hydrolase/transferase [Clostridia bacterium]